MVTWICMPSIGQGEPKGVPNLEKEWLSVLAHTIIDANENAQYNRTAYHTFYLLICKCINNFIQSTSLGFRVGIQDTGTPEAVRKKLCQWDTAQNIEITATPRYLHRHQSDSAVLAGCHPS